MSDGILWDNVNVVGSWFCGSANQVIVADHVTTMVTTEAAAAVVVQGPRVRNWFAPKFMSNRELEKLTGSETTTRGLVMMVETKDAEFLASQGWLEQFEFKTEFASGRIWRLTPAGLQRFCDQPEPTS